MSRWTEPAGFRAVRTLEKFLRDAGWSPQTVDGADNLFRVAFSGEHGRMQAVAQVLPELNQFLFYVGCSTRAPEERRQQVMEFVTRSNYGLRIGAFELDLSDGEVRFRSALDFEGTELTESLIRNTIAPAVHTMDLYMGGLMKVMFGGVPATDAIEEIEGTDQDPAPDPSEIAQMGEET